MVSGFPDLVYEAPKKQSDNIEIGPNDISIDLLRAVYRANHLPLHTRMRAAMAALPHEVPRLAVTAQITEQDFATLLDRRLKRLEEFKLIEANGGKVTDAQPQPVETKPPLARTPDRRFRRF
jgi:hypothetical protein